MDKKIRLLVIVLVLLGVLSTSIAGWFYLQKEALYREYIEVEKTLTSENLALTDELNSVKTELNTANNERRQLQYKIETVSKELEKASSESVVLKKEKSKLNDKINNLNEQISSLAKIKDSLEKKVKELESKPPVYVGSDEFLSKLLKEKAALQVEINDLRMLVSEKNGHSTQLTNKLDSVSYKLEEIKQAKLKVEEELIKSRQVADALSQELLTEKRNKVDTAKKLEKLQTDNKELQRQLSQLEDLKKSLQAQLYDTTSKLNKVSVEKNELSAKIDKMNNVLKLKLSELNQMKSTLENAIEETKQISRLKPKYVELPAIVVKADENKRENNRYKTYKKKDYLISKESVAQPIVRQEKQTPKNNIAEQEKIKIITVNNKHDFVVINLGVNGGIREGMDFDVYRKDKKVGVIRIIETRKQISAADIKEGKIKVGDIVKYSRD